MTSSGEPLADPHSIEEHLAEVLSRYDGSPDPRLAEITTAAIRHLHAFVTEVGLTRDEWWAGIEALTAIGQLCGPTRQEFVLLSDTLGVSMLVEMINHRAVVGATEPTVVGPFHVAGAPERELGATIVVDPTPDDEPVVFSGTVRDTSGQPVAGARLDVWSTAANGSYDVQDPGQTAMNMRGVFTADDQGRYEFTGVRPVAYPIPGDGPAGALLFANGRHNVRPGHLHMVVSAPGYQTLVTHVFDRASEHLDDDPVFGVRSSLVRDMSDGRCRFDVVVQPID